MIKNIKQSHCGALLYFHGPPTHMGRLHKEEYTLKITNNCFICLLLCVSLGSLIIISQRIFVGMNLFFFERVGKDLYIYTMMEYFIIFHFYKYIRVLSFDEVL